MKDTQFLSLQFECSVALVENELESDLTLRCDRMTIGFMRYLYFNA